MCSAGDCNHGAGAVLLLTPARPLRTPILPVGHGGGEARLGSGATSALSRCVTRGRERSNIAARFHQAPPA